jgi:hypothetical protein
MVLDFLLKVLLYLCLPSVEFARCGQGRAIDAHAEGEGVLVLAGERDKILVAEHELII